MIVNVWSAVMKFRKVRCMLLAILLLACCSFFYWLIFVNTHPSKLDEMEHALRAGNVFPHQEPDGSEFRGRIVRNRGKAAKSSEQRAMMESKFFNGKNPLAKTTVKVDDAEKDEALERDYGDPVQRNNADNDNVGGIQDKAVNDDDDDEYNGEDDTIDHPPVNKNLQKAEVSDDKNGDHKEKDGHEKISVNQNADADKYGNVPIAQPNKQLPGNDDFENGKHGRNVADGERPEVRIADSKQPLPKNHQQENPENVDDDYVSLDDEKLKHGKSPLEPPKKNVPKQEPVTPSVDVPRSNNDLEEVEIDPESRRAKLIEAVADPDFLDHYTLSAEQVMAAGAQAGHVRAHNVPPVPRVQGDVFRRLEPTKRPPKTYANDEDDVAALPPLRREAGDANMAAVDYFLVHSGRASRVHGAVHANLRPIPDDVPPQSYIFTSPSLPENPRLRPSIGNGYLATVIHGPYVFMSGLYNGRDVDSHRAAIPSTCSFTIKSTVPEVELQRTYSLNVGTGIYSELISGPSFNITQQIYVHRRLSNLIVVEVDFWRADIDEQLQLNIALNRWTSSYDLTFVKPEYNKEEVSYKVGTLNAKETTESIDREVHILYDHIPNELVPPRGARRTKWVFLTAIGLTKHEAESFYENGVKQIHNSDELYASHVRAWSGVWSRGRIDIEGNKQLAQTAYASLYYTLSSLPLKYRSQFVGISPCGLPLGDAGNDYEGRVMYDQELWTFPPLLLLHNDLSSHIITSRRRFVGAARRSAAAKGRNGAAFPWQSGADGVELYRDAIRSTVSPYVSAGIVWSVLQSVYASNRSGDVTNTTIGEMVAEICNFLLRKVEHIPLTEHYTIKGVLPIDESHGRVDSSPFVNGITKLALNTLDYVYSLENKTTADFRHYGDGIVIPLENSVEAIHPAYTGYQRTVAVSQADAVLLGYPLLIPMPFETRKNDLIHYDRMLTAATASPMTWAMHAIGWLEIGDRRQAQTAFFKQLAFIRNEFQVWSNSSLNATNSAYNYLPAMGGFLQSLLNGYVGIRLRHNRLDLNPVLPPGVKKLSLTGLDYLGSHLNVVFNDDELSIMVTSSSHTAVPLKVYAVNPEEIHSLALNHAVKFQRRRASIISASSPLPH